MRQDKSMGIWLSLLLVAAMLCGCVQFGEPAPTEATQATQITEPTDMTQPTVTTQPATEPTTEPTAPPTEAPTAPPTQPIDSTPTEAPTPTEPQDPPLHPDHTELPVWLIPSILTVVAITAMILLFLFFRGMRKPGRYLRKKKTKTSQ